MIEMGARWYDPKLARWASADSIVPDPANPQSLNRFAYVYNNPLKYVDPTGQYTEQEIMEHFGVDEWKDVLAFFEEGGELEGQWGWLEILRGVRDGDPLGYVSETGEYVQIGTFYRCEVHGTIRVKFVDDPFFGSLPVNSVIEGYPGTWDTYWVEYLADPFYSGGPFPGRVRATIDPNHKYVYPRPNQDLDWFGLGCDGVGVIAGYFEPRPVALGVGWIADIASLSHTIHGLETGDADPLDLVLDVASFVPKFGIIPDLISIGKELVVIGP